MPEYLIGIDLGGSGARCLLLNLATRETRAAHCAWSLIPEPEAGRFAYRLDPDVVWQAIAEATRDVLRQAGVHPAQVAGLAVASMRHTTVALDATGRVLLMTPNRDARAASQALQLAAEHGEAIQAIGGHYPNPIFLAARLLWLREEQPQAFDSLAWVMSLSDWAGYRMTGVPSAESAQAGETMLLDIHQRTWAQPLLRRLEIPDQVLPPLRTAGERLGDLTRAAADDLGLMPGTPVAVGGPDTQCGLLGMGILAPGEVGIVAGTTAPVQWVTERPITADAGLWAGLHLLPGRYILESNAGSVGATLDWLARLCFAADPQPTARWLAEAEAARQPTSDAYSTIGARRFDARALAMPVDTFTFSALAAEALPNAVPQFARAVVEGMAYAIRANLEQLAAVAGPMQRLGLAGGMSRNPFWRQLLADVLEQTVYASAVVEASALGAAFCAGVGAGLFDSLTTAAQALVRPAEAHRPGAQSATYHRLYAAWSQLCQARREADALASEHVTEAVLEAPTVQQAAPVPDAFRPRVFVSAEIDEASRAQLSRLADVIYRPYREAGVVLTGDELAQALQGCHVFITEVDVVDAEVLLQLPDLRAVIVCRGNPVNVDVEACSLAGVVVAHTPARNADAVADLTMAFILALARKLPSALAFLHQPGGEAGDLGRLGQAHEAFLGVELWRKTVGLIGGGAVGRKVAARLLPFGTRVLICDPFLSESQITRMGAEKVSLAQLLAQSDFVSLHAPVTDETRGMINAQTLAQMKPGAFLVNTARAALVDEAAVCQALHQGRLGGYATDVFAVEPPAADDPLLNAPNVIATPHIGGNTQQVAAHQGEAAARALTQLLAGQAPDHALNPDVMRSFRWRGPRAMDAAALHQRRQRPGPAVTDLEAAAAGRRSPAAAEGSTAAQTPALPSSSSHSATPASAPPATNETRQKVLALLDDFTRRVAADAELATFAKGKQVTFLFTLKDLDQPFYLSFIDGKVTAGVGTPSVHAEVRLKTTTEVLDGIFTGRVNPTKAALSGKLSFSGDTARAMAFMRIQGHMSRLYAQARAAVGELGNLAELTSPAVAPQPVAAASIVSVPSAPPAGGQWAGDSDALNVVKITQELYAKGLITATGGNVSARCADKADEIWITPSGLFKGELRAEMLVRINLDGQVVRPTEHTASSELRIHCAIYRKMPDVQAVIHSHPEYATLMSLVGMKFEPISTEAAFIGELPVVPFIMPGSEALAEAVSEAMRKHGLAVLMQNHGMVVAGSSLRRAADWTENIEITARKLILCRLLGKKPARIADATVKLLREVGASIG